MNSNNTEIERKFLVRDESFRKLASEVRHIRQGYLCRDKGRTVRIRIQDEKAYITIKGEAAADGISRFEWEKEIAREDAEQLLGMCLSTIIDKERYVVPNDGTVVEVDVFHGEHEGLILAEIELKSADEEYVKPSFLGSEVSFDKAYSNARLSLTKNLYTMFTTSDLEQLAARHITVEAAEKQMESFRKGFPSLEITAAAGVGNGILVPDSAEEERYMQAWDEYLQEDHTILKFVPASGAASRMFKNLFEYMDGGEQTAFISEFLGNLERFAFYGELKKLMDERGVTEGRDIVRLLLEDMQYGKLPKGLLLFHQYADGARTPALEHLVEGAMYAQNKKQEVNLHFTISHEHKELFEKHISSHLKEYEERYGVHFNVSFSEQKPSTDTLAADKDGMPFRDKDGKLVFRPGGHGALIENLGEQQADVVFVKNIDNVVPDRLKEPTVRYKRLIAGVLVSLQKQAFEYLRALEAGEANEQEVAEFIEKRLCCQLPNRSRELLISKLNRPIRVCGMVKNEGEPGGGPFMVRNQKDGSVQCQILESSQIADKSLMQTATHFNPVDLVCGLRDYKGRAFDLKQYVDPLTAFISQKSKDGKELQALELPGLWNGAMADWNTVFVEVPIETFNPVKTVNDLLREQHQG